MDDIVAMEAIGSVGVITVDNPPVNALGAKTRRALAEAFAEMADDDAVEAVVLLCAGRTFFAGADISEFGRVTEEPSLPTLLDIVENSAKPVIAAIHGTALGGGYELALVCHYRIAASSARIGLPEVRLGIMPGAGGTQRLPRIIGVPAALEIITSGAQVPAPRALELGMVDALTDEGRLRDDAIALARTVLADRHPPRRIRDRDELVEPFRGRSEVYEEFLRHNAKDFRCLRAPFAIVEAVQAAADLPFDEGLRRERQLLADLREGTQSAALRYVFFAERGATRIPDIPVGLTRRSVGNVGVVGAGTMGGGITMSFLDAGIPVTLIEIDGDRLGRGMDAIRRAYGNKARKGRITLEDVDRRMALVTPSVSLDALAEADLVVEAAYEEMRVKKALFGEFDKVVRPGAILASNTSYLDLDEIAAATDRPQDVVGMHFFSPANVMRLLEVVRGSATAPDVIATVFELAKSIGKVPVLAGVCHGFIANRVMAPRRVQAERLVLEGPTPQEIDDAMVDFGFAMGPFRMNDLVGLDVTIRGQTARSLRGDLVALGRLGQKQNGGFYDYDEHRAATPSPVAAQVIADFAEHQGIRNGGAKPPADIVARLLYPVVNEGARVLEEGIALRASDIDVACILGYNWPAFTGGPMFWADTVGLDAIVAGLDAQGIAPARWLAERAERGEKLTG